jgi:exodeoxyribonuclease V beta subunit
MKDFDLIAAPLTGTNLIEASAGTGKTYTIAGLFVRLVVEKALFVSEILVVTYTVAATEELKNRIRRKLREALVAFSSGKAEDHFLQGLLEKYPNYAQRSIVRERIAMAIRNFDEAAIYTIHGFCRRTLQKSAFESGFLFDTHLITDQQKFKEEIVHDFWRRHFYETIPELVGYALAQGYSPAYLLKLTGREFSHPDIRVIPEEPLPSLQSIRSMVDKFNEEFMKLRRVWAQAREEVRKRLQSPALKANIYGDRVEALMVFMDHFVASETPFLSIFSDFEKFTPSKIASSVRKNCTLPEHTVFRICDNLRNREKEAKAQMDRYLLGLKAKLIGILRVELPALKQKRNVLFYDDLLRKLKTALEKNGGASLVQAIRGKYKAALIDEFQDTDSLQYAIFHTIFGLGKESGSILFLIGDPKQSIYAFRGADLFAYIKAAYQADNKYTLRQNWRSVSDLVEAINIIFSCAARPFVHEEISFFSTQTAKNRPELPALTIDGRKEAPFRWWFVPAGTYSTQGRPLAKEQAAELIVKAVAARIARLVSLGKEQRAFIGPAPLAERDIAVLVRTNRQARQVEKALKELKIPCVLYNTENLFDSREAYEVQQLLTGIAYPADERRFKAALITSLLGINGNALERLEEDENQWEEWLRKFNFYHDLWLSRGFIVMFKTLMDRQDVRARLLSLPDGERRLTNALHLAEVLHQEAATEGLGMSGLLKWLEKQRNPETPRKEEHQLRLESDDDAVRISTIHKSKGLEYPIVFCPFSWEGSRIGKDSLLTFHDPQNDDRLTCDLGSPDWQAHKKWAEKELLAENIRLLYVALTRAKCCCYFVWGRFNDSETSAPAYLLHTGGLIEHSLDEIANRVKSLSDEDMYNKIAALAARGETKMNLSELPVSAEHTYIPRHTAGKVLHCRQFQGSIDRLWQVMSFSSLVSSHPQRADIPDLDAMENTQAAEYRKVSEKKPLDLGPGVFTLPGGVRTGSLLHDILEHLDFTETNQSALESLVAEKLAEYGFEAKWLEAIVEMLKNVIHTPIDRQDKLFTLSAIPPSDRVNELEFYFPVEGFSGRLLRQMLDDHGLSWFPKDMPATKRLFFDPLRGFMKGFIDMFFQYKDRYYLIDWKSNDLGDQREDYDQTALRSVMKDSFYLFQSFLYTVALHQYLKLRVAGYRYDTHFGGAYYLFLRGIRPDWGPEIGVYCDKPPSELIDAFCLQFIKKCDFAL